MESVQPEEDLAEDAKIGNITRSGKRVNRNIIPSSCNALNACNKVVFPLVREKNKYLDTKTNHFIAGNQMSQSQARTRNCVRAS